MLQLEGERLAAVEHAVRRELGQLAFTLREPQFEIAQCYVREADDGRDVGFKIYAGRLLAALIGLDEFADREQ